MSWCAGLAAWRNNAVSGSSNDRKKGFFAKFVLETFGGKKKEKKVNLLKLNCWVYEAS